MSIGYKSSLTKAQQAKKATRSFYYSLYKEILAEIRKASAFGKDNISVEKELGLPLIHMLKEDGFYLASGIKGWTISWDV